MSPLDSATVDRWLAELGLEPIERGERDGISSWDLRLDGQRRADIRFTVILDPHSAVLLWVHFAPPLNDSFRVSYRQFLRWNDELPFVKFALSADDRPMLTSELALDRLDRDGLGLAVGRLLAVCDLTLERSVSWLFPGRRTPPPMDRPSRQAALFERYADDLEELLGTDLEDDEAASELRSFSAHGLASALNPSSRQPEANPRTFASGESPTLQPRPMPPSMPGPVAPVIVRPQRAAGPAGTAGAVRGRFRPDIEGLRGLAVLLVVVFHASPELLSGGFIGVDVFFVISGFLITGLLYRELGSSGRISFSGFYLRRIRRLFPAAALAIAGILVLSAWLLSPLALPRVAADAVASALSVSNIRFALTTGDYFSAVATPSPFLHFWSLSVEEQFYLVWPALLLLVYRLGGARLVATAVALIAVASLLLALAMTEAAPTWAFYSLPTRAWQLGSRRPAGHRCARALAERAGLGRSGHDRLGRAGPGAPGRPVPRRPERVSGHLGPAADAGRRGPHRRG